MRQALNEAARSGYAIGAFNVNNMEQIQAVMQAARNTSSPAIIQVSRGGRAHMSDRFLSHLMLAVVEEYQEIPLVLHFDHGNSPAACRSAIEMGFTSVMMDGSLLEDGKTPSSFEYNVKKTTEVVEFAHSRGVSVEGELGCIGGIEDGHGVGNYVSTYLTDPGQAIDFVARTGIDALAVAIGTSHGAYKFAHKPNGQSLAMDRLQEIHRRLPEVPLVLHGSSSVPQNLLRLINRYGGAIKPTWGVPIEDLQFGIRHGVRKINVDTDSRLAVTGAVRRFLAKNPEQFDPRGYLKEARDAMRDQVMMKMKSFGQAGHASDHLPVTTRNYEAPL
jgi:fructose-bisphosphate aldolase class II